MRSFTPLLFILSLLPFCLHAKPVIDSVGIENQNGKKIILHKLDPKDNYYSIARRYKVKPQAVIAFNNNAVLHVGGIIKVPTNIPFVETPVSNPVATPSVADGAVIQYKVAPHEYLYGIAKRFNTTVEDIRKLNNLQKDVLSPGQILNIHQGAQTTVVVQQPQTIVTNKQVVVVQQAQPVQTTANVNPSAPASAIQYKVTKHEYLYSVAKRFNTTPEQIKALNNLTSNALMPGMVINIPQATIPTTVIAGSAKTDTVPPARQDTTHVAGIADSLANHKAPSRYGLFEKNEHGIATWMDDPSFDQSKKLILHRTAPIGTVIKITNPMTGRVTFAKVVGRFTDNESTKDVIIVMTKNVAEALGALDKRFRVNISYGVANE